MDCFKKDTCANSGVKCVECAAMADMYNNYPCYLQKPMKIKLGGVEKVKLFHSVNPGVLQGEINTFIKDKTVVDILYHPVEIPKPPYVSDRVMIVYKEET